MRIGFVELVLLLFIASITVGPNVALFADRWLRRAQRTSAAAARRKAQLEAQAAIEREALMTRFRVASNIFALLMLAALAYGLLLRPIDTLPKAYTAPDVRQDTGAAQTALSADSKDSWKLGGYLGVDCVRTQDGLVYAAAYNGAAMKKRQSDLVRTDGGHYAAILSVEGELTSFAFDADGDLWLTVVTSSGGALCRARHRQRANNKRNRRGRRSPHENLEGGQPYMPKFIVIVEDDESIREMLRYYFQSVGYEVHAYESGEALFEAEDWSVCPALCILDIMLPGMDGLEILNRLRTGKATEELPVIMLTARSSEIDRVTGLESGADAAE